MSEPTTSGGNHAAPLPIRRRSVPTFPLCYFTDPALGELSRLHLMVLGGPETSVAINCRPDVTPVSVATT